MRIITIKELMNILQKYDENLEVWVRDEFGRNSDIWDEEEIFIDKLEPDSDKEVLIIRW